MDIRISNTPAQAAGEYITALIAGRDSLVFLSGGSALDVFAHITLPEKVRTIFCMGDERWSREPNANNYAQLTARYHQHPALSAVIDTSVIDGESLREFTNRLNFEISKFFQTKSESTPIQTIALLGIGSDGHTASIFPVSQDMTSESFTETYEADSTYVSVPGNGLRIDSRASITPAVIQSMDQTVGYAVGEVKKPILESLINTSKTIQEMPAKVIQQHPHSTLFTDVTIES